MALVWFLAACPGSSLRDFSASAMASLASSFLQQVHHFSVGLAAAGLKEQQVVERLARWGVPRICPLGRMQCPPLTWRHDGRPSLGELVTWTDWELPSRW